MAREYILFKEKKSDNRGEFELGVIFRFTCSLLDFCNRYRMFDDYNNLEKCFTH